MLNIFRELFGLSKGRYELEALVSARTIETDLVAKFDRHIICDLDKTYIETEFESWVKMARIPFERPHEKITVAGASEVLQSARWSFSHAETEFAERTPAVGLHFVSSSPPQLRSALEGKLIIDDLDWSSDTFKNQTYNLRMARIDLLKHHIAYKTRAILDVLRNAKPGAGVWMIGDNAEYDGFIYVGVKLFLEGILSIKGLKGWLGAARVESQVVGQVVSDLLPIQEKKLRVEGIFIRKLAGYPIIQLPPVTSLISQFESWFQIYWRWFRLGFIESTTLWPTIRAYHNQHGLPLSLFESILSQAQRDETFVSLKDDAKLEIQNVQHKLIGLIGTSPSIEQTWEGLMLDSVKELPEKFTENDAVALAGRWYQLIVDSRH